MPRTVLDVGGAPRAVLGVGQGDRHGPEGPVSAYETGVVRSDVGVGLSRVVGNVGIGVELDRQTFAKTANPQSAAGTPDRSHTARIVMKDHRRPICAAVIGTEIDLKSEREILAHIDALARHRRPDIKRAPRRRQGNDITGDTRIPIGRQGRIGGRNRLHLRGTGWLDQQPRDGSTEVHGVHVVVGSPAEPDRKVGAAV